jgi:hypothetical protein
MRSGPAGSGAGVTLVAVAAQERGDLGFQGGLGHQPNTEPGDLLQDHAKVLVAGEQLVDLGATRSTGDTRAGMGVGFRSRVGARSETYARPLFHRS